MTTKLTDKNISNVANLGIQWQAVITADGSTTTTAVAGRGYLIDTTSNAHTINLPSSAIAGDTIAIKDYAGTFGSNALTIGRNGSNIQGVANNSEISTNRASVELIYVDSTKGWVYTNESNVADLEKKLYITATGGTITTSGDFKIHTFTGDGCFVVSQLGNPVGGPSTVDYLVVAGGGGAAGGSGGGGGAGGYRESHSTCNSGPYTASPLATPTGITLSVQTYPVTVGGGGGGPGDGGDGGTGSNSVFSTITSAGGGGGDHNTCGGSGGSGGGAGYNGGTGGSGNTPPTSPPQGNPGGLNPSLFYFSAAGGGGAGGPGSNRTPAGAGGGGGVGTTTTISGTPLAYAGGGGGTGGGPNGGPGVGGPGSPCGTGGAGSGFPRSNGVAGTANRGGGGGSGLPNGGAGGKGIVIIRYKFQN